jgi:hypothetical protein
MSAVYDSGESPEPHHYLVDRARRLAGILLDPRMKDVATRNEVRRAAHDALVACVDALAAMLESALAYSAAMAESDQIPGVRDPPAAGPPEASPEQKNTAP